MYIGDKKAFLISSPKPLVWFFIYARFHICLWFYDP